MRFRPSIVIVMLIFATGAFASDYVLQAPQWGDPQRDAVTAAGGVVTFAHERTGFATASSDDPAFADRLNASGVFTMVAEDKKIHWQGAVQQAELADTAVTPLNEPFWNMEWWARAINAPDAWAAGYNGRGVRIAVLDGGLYDKHVDLKDKIDREHSKSFVPGFEWNTDDGTIWHGTFVAGVIAAADNNIGIVGIAPESTLIGVKVIHGEIGEFGWVISGLLYAADPISEGGGGADIINVSFSEFIDVRGGNGPLVSAMAKAVNYAESRGVLVVCAVGNAKLDLGQKISNELTRSFIFLPAEVGSGIAVSGTGPVGYGFGSTDFRTFGDMYSNYGEGAIWIAAPGGNFMLDGMPEGEQICSVPRIPSGIVSSRCKNFDMILTTARGSNPSSTTTYAFALGTSMAAAHVSAVAALVKQAHPGISVGALKTLLARTADDEGRTGTDQYYGHGFLNAAKAVR